MAPLYNRLQFTEECDRDKCTGTLISAATGLWRNRQHAHSCFHRPEGRCVCYGFERLNPTKAVLATRD